MSSLVPISNASRDRVVVGIGIVSAIEIGIMLLIWIGITELRYVVR